MRRLIALVVALALTTAACGGDDDNDSEAGRAADETTTSTTAPADGTTTTSTPSTTVDPNAPTATGTGQGATAPAQGSGGQGTTATTSKSSTSNAAIKPAAPGAYTYTRTGTARTSAFGERSLNGNVNLQVDPPNQAAGEQRSVQSAPDGSTEQIIRLLPEGAYFTYLKQTSGGITKEFRPNPIVLAIPSNPTPGRTWSWTVTSTDGETTLKADFKVERTETLTIGGEATRTHVLNVVLTISGDIQATTNQTSWVSLDKGLIVRSDERTDGSFGNITFNSQSSMTLNSTRPA